MVRQIILGVCDYMSNVIILSLKFITEQLIESVITSAQELRGKNGYFNHRKLKQQTSKCEDP